MTRRKLEEKNIRKLSKSGNSYSVTLPIEEIRELGWHKRQKVVVERKGKTLIIRDWE